MHLVQIDTEQWREIINYSVPLFALIVMGFGIYRSIKWLASKFLEPLGGPDGKIAVYLEHQQEEAKSQTYILRELTSQFAAYGAETKAGLDALVRMHADEDSVFASKKVELRTLDLLKAQGHVGAILQELASDSVNEDTVQEHARQIDLIVEKYL